MTNVFKVYQSGLQAFEKENFAEAIELLEAYCQQGANSQSLEYDRACKTLVKAYQAVQEIDKAIALCQELTQSKKPQVRFWAQRWLEQLSAQQEIIGSGTKNTDATNQLPTNGSQPDLEKEHRQPQPSLTPEQANRLLIEGRNALRSKQYPQAIQALEQFSQGVDALHPEYYQVQMWLATAYQQNHQLQAALALGQKLATIENPTIQAWTTQFLQSLSVLIATETVSQIASSQTVVSTRKENPPSSRKNTPESAESGFKLQNLSEFKSFCRNTLKSDLQEFEKKRQSALQALIVVGTIICVVLTVAMTLAPKVLGAISLYQSIIPENICQEFEQLPSEKQEEYVASISEGQLSVSEFSIGCQKSQFSFNNLQSFLLIFAVFLIIFVGCLWSWAIFYSVQTEMYERGFKS
jgi:tetratricopeptide (TPR) repeat protein